RFSIPPRWYAFFEGTHDEITGYTIGNRALSERDYLPDECIKRSNQIKGQSRKRVTFLARDEIRALVIAAKQGDLPARNKLIDHCRPCIEGIAKRYASVANPVEDLINQAIMGTPSESGEVTNGLLYAIKKFDPENGGAFLSFIREPIRNAIL